MGALNGHPDVSCGYEVFAAKSLSADKLRDAVGYKSHNEQLADVGGFTRKYWGLCPAATCGFKVMPNQVARCPSYDGVCPPPNSLPQLFEAADGAEPPLLILLERRNTTACGIGN